MAGVYLGVLRLYITIWYTLLINATLHNGAQARSMTNLILSWHASRAHAQLSGHKLTGLHRVSSFLVREMDVLTTPTQLLTLKSVGRVSCVVNLTCPSQVECVAAQLAGSI